MKRMWLLLVTTLLVNVAAATCKADPRQDPRRLFCLATNTTINVDIKKIHPPVLTPSDASIYLSEASCLGYLGPIGPYGPLGILGPLGDGTWSPQYWISGAFSWDDYAKMITGLGGPLSADGPLGANGPMTAQAMYERMPCINDFAHQMLAGGLWTVLGPLGPLGPLGGLGPLGPIGAHGFKRDSVGRYVDSHGKVQRSVTVPFNATYARKFELFERYTQEFASSGVAAAEQDSSFMVDGIWDGAKLEQSVFGFASAVDQMVTLLVVPQYQLDSFSLTVFDTRLNPLSATSSIPMISWIQMRVKANERLFVLVDLFYSGHVLSKPYTLYVVGSTNEFQLTDIAGPHILPRPF